MSDPRALFVAAFNDSDLDAMAALLSADASAQVLGAPFPEEQGAATNRHTSFPHICELDLVASLTSVGGAEWILLRTEGGRGPIDTALKLRVVGATIERIEYLVAPHQPEQLRALGAACGLPTLAEG